MLTVFGYGMDEGASTAGVRTYLFSTAAKDYVRREEPGWQAWLDGLAVRA